MKSKTLVESLRRIMRVSEVGMATCTFEEWRRDADDALMRRFCITLDDAGVEDAQLRNAHAHGEQPGDFVIWFAEKYDLTERRALAF